jgi:hypothetical protein
MSNPPWKGVASTDRTWVALTADTTPVQSERESSPAECSLPFLSPRRLLELQLTLTSSVTSTGRSSDDDADYQTAYQSARTVAVIGGRG